MTGDKMNKTEEIKQIYEQRCLEFINYYNDHQEEQITEITEQKIKASLLKDALYKFNNANPDIEEYQIDYEWLQTIVPNTEEITGNALLESFNQCNPANRDYLKDLTEKEKREYAEDEKKLRDAELDINRKYSALASQRITHDTIIKEILSMTKIAPKEKLERYYTLSEAQLVYDADGVHGERLSKDFQEIFENRLKESTNEQLAIVLDVLRLIELPEK